ncbi:MAG TPA: SARP family transcriptional regulator, partial [Actinomycetota bacterium]|nr:SARP family transcriptional regulator [Actinomycetota bacterium]
MKTATTPESQAQVDIRLLGPPEVRVTGHPMHVDTRKAVALLAYLAVIAGPVRREHLAALLWPELPEDRAKGALRRTLSVLRAALGGRGLVVGGHSISMDE